MSYHKVPKHWKEKDCTAAVESLLAEGLRRYGKDKHENASQCFLEVARIIRSIPEVRRREIHRILQEKKLKKKLKNSGVMEEGVARDIITDKVIHDGEKRKG